MKIIAKAIILTCISITAILPAAAIENATIQKNAVLSITDCIQLALQNSPAIKKARYNYNVSKNNASIAKSDYFPTIGVGTGYYATENATSSSLMRRGRNNYYSAEASLTQLIWDFGKTNANIRMNKFNAIAALYTFDDTVLDTIFGVKTNYYGVLAAKAAVDINKANVQINERNYQRTKAYFEEGIKSKIDLVNAEVNLSDSKVTLVNAVKNYQNALVKLNNSMYIAFAPEYEITNTETFNFDANVPVSLEKIDDKVDISPPPEGVSDAFLTSKVEKIDILDIGVGSGCISCALAKKLQNKNIEILAVDISLQAIKTALENADKLDLIRKIVFRKSDVYSKIRDCEKFDLIVSNPPYIPLKEKNILQREVSFEPEIALFATDNNGVEFYEKIIKDASKLLKKDDNLDLKIGVNQIR